MRFVVCAIYLIIIMPITSTGWAEGSNILLDPANVCKGHRKLPKKLAQICKYDTSLLSEIKNGISLGFRECETQFRNRRWNCTAQKRSMKRILVKDTRETAFVNAITSAGIAYAVTKACSMGDLVECSCDKNLGRRHNMVKYKVEYIDEKNSNSNNNNNNNFANNSNNNSRNRKKNNNNYSNNNSNKNNSNLNLNINQNQNKNRNRNNRKNNNNNEIPRNSHNVQTLDADENRKTKYQKAMERKMRLHQKKNGKENPHNSFQMPDSQWKWGGCDDNVNFGVKKSRDFLNARKKRSDIKTLVKLHNNDAGRLAVKKSMRLECKCHGLSGSCTMKSCWMRLPIFREVGDSLKERFDGASKVIASNDGNSFMPEWKTIKPPTRGDLVYTDNSPDFCEPNMKTGSLGTHGRECNTTSLGQDGCDLLCCDRGFQRTIEYSTVKCNCVFFWCCEVKCNTCETKREFFTCK